jgi:hypothetical protein
LPDEAKNEAENEAQNMAYVLEKQMVILQRPGSFGYPVSKSAAYKHFLACLTAFLCYCSFGEAFSFAGCGVTGGIGVLARVSHQLRQEGRLKNPILFT